MHYLVLIYNHVEQKIVHQEPFYFELELNHYLENCKVNQDEILIVREISPSGINHYTYDPKFKSYVPMNMTSMH